MYRVTKKLLKISLKSFLVTLFLSKRIHNHSKSTIMSPGDALVSEKKAIFTL